MKSWKPKFLARNLELCRFQAFYLELDLLCEVGTLLRDTMYLLEMLAYDYEFNQKILLLSFKNIHCTHKFPNNDLTTFKVRSP